MTKIGILIAIQISLVIGSFAILAYNESQLSLMGNSINIAGKNRFFTSNLVLQTEKYFDGRSNISDVNNATSRLDLNIRTLKEGDRIAGGGEELQPLPSQYDSYWEQVNQKWQGLKALIGQMVTSFSSSSGIGNSVNADKRTEIETAANSLVQASDNIVVRLSQGVKEKVEGMVQLEISLLVVNAAVHVLMLYIIVRMLRPIIAITRAMRQLKNGNFDVAGINHGHGKDEISALASSFNEMVANLKLYDSMQKEFISIAAHELRTPIQPIIGLTDLLNQKESNSISEYRPLLEIINRNANKLNKLIGSLLNVARIESRSLRLDKELFCLNDIIVEAIADAEKSVDNKVTLSYLYSQEGRQLVIVNADRTKITEVISNLLGNAIKYAAEGRVFITLEKGKIEGRQFAIISVKDSGPGINHEIYPKLFTKFASKSEGGTGLGLFISKAIVEAHGGKIWAKNNRDGSGATFAFSLPIAGKEI